MITVIYSPLPSLRELNVYDVKKFRRMPNCEVAYSGNITLLRDKKTGKLHAPQLFKNSLYILGKQYWANDFLKCCVALKVITQKQFKAHQEIIELLGDKNKIFQDLREIRWKCEFYGIKMPRHVEATMEKLMADIDAQIEKIAEDAL